METRTQFELDWEKPMRINTMESNRGYYNLVLSIRDLGLHTKIGMKPHRHWRLKDVKQYFGITGSASSMLATLQAFKNNEL